MLDVARKRYGKPFAHEKNSNFIWRGGPSVLTRWLVERAMERQADLRPPVEIVQRLAAPRQRNAA